MSLKIRGTATLFAVLLAVVPGVVTAEDSPLGVFSKTSAEGQSRPSTGIATAMLISPKMKASLDQAAPQGDPFLPVHLSSGLSLPAPRGKVIFEHHWSAGDIPAAFAKPGGGKAGNRFANRKFRLGTNPDGRYKIVRDPETGVDVLDILVTRDDEAKFRTHHTEVEVHIPGYWIDGRFMMPGQRYLLELWRKNINYKSDSHWEIWWQSHSMYDSSVEAKRNPSIAIDGGRKGSNRLSVRADSKAITRKDSNGNWIYDRAQAFGIGENTSNLWEFWQMEVKIDADGGLLYLWRNGKLVHSEKGLPVGYNDLRGPPWSFGWYKYFSKVSTFKRQAYIGPVRVQKL
jgi:hypothetical protein